MPKEPNCSIPKECSYASEFLNAGHLNLDNYESLIFELRRFLEWPVQINESAAETYGFEINQLIEEAE